MTSDFLVSFCMVRFTHHRSVYSFYSFMDYDHLLTSVIDKYHISLFSFLCYPTALIIFSLYTFHWLWLFLLLYFYSCPHSLIFFLPQHCILVPLPTITTIWKSFTFLPLSYCSTLSFTWTSYPDIRFPKTTFLDQACWKFVAKPLMMTWCFKWSMSKVLITYAP